MRVIYKTEHIDSGKIYIGKSKKSEVAFKSYYGSGTILRSAINKYGKGAFTKTIIEECDTDEQLNEREKYWIKEFNSITPYGYNIHDGGLGGDSFHHLNKAQKKRIFEKRLNDNPNMYIKINETKIKNGTNKHSIEHIENLTIANRKKAQDPFWRKKQSEIQLANSSTEKIYKIKLTTTDEIVELKNIREVKDYVDNYNKTMNKKYRERSNYWKLLYEFKTNDMIMVDKRRANYE